jgi:hypothetical protein
MEQRRPTRRQLEVLRAYITAGSIAAAAYDLGISETTARQHLSGLYRRLGCLNAAQAAYHLGVAESERPIEDRHPPGVRWAASQPARQGLVSDRMSE